MTGFAKRLMLSLCCGLALISLSAAADGPAQLFDDAKKPGKQGDPAQCTVRLDGKDYRLTGPYKQENLAVYLIHAKAEARHDQDFLTLDEGLRRGVVIVREKKNGGSVEELIIENRGDLPLYLQEGDRLSGGQQDRTVQTPLVIAPKSGPRPLATFCIEQSRWKPANAENKFAATTNAATAPKAVRQAAKFGSNQSQVWNQVALTKEAYARSLKSNNTNSSLNESLDSDSARKAARDYTEPLSRLVAENKDVVGVAFAMNGQIEEVNLYAGHPLAAKMFPRLLESYAMEAATEKYKPAGEAKPDDGKAEAKPPAKREPKNADERAFPALYKALGTPLNTRYNGMDFEKTLAHLSGVMNVEFVIDWDAIEKAGVRRDRKIELRVRSTPGEDVIRQVLRSAGGSTPSALGHAVANGRIFISERIAVAGNADRVKSPAGGYVTLPPEKLPTPALDVVEKFMDLPSGKPTERRIDAMNLLQVSETNGLFHSRSLADGKMIHQQWMRAATKEAAAK